MLRDPVKLRNVEEEMERVRGQLAHAETLQAALELQAGVGGQLVMPRQADMEGVSRAPGTLLGTSSPASGAPCRWPSSRMWRPTLVRDDTRGVSVRLAELPGDLPARVLRAVPAATSFPSAALGILPAGGCRVDPPTLITCAPRRRSS